MQGKTKLSDLHVSQSGVVESLNVSGSLRRRLRDIGLIGGTRVECVLVSPSKDPKAYNIRGAVIALRNEDAENILLRDVE